MERFGWKFSNLRDEIINMKNIIIKKVQDENVQLKETIANLQHNVIILGTATNLWSNTIEEITLR